MAVAQRIVDVGESGATVEREDLDPRAGLVLARADQDLTGGAVLDEIGRQFRRHDRDAPGRGLAEAEALGHRHGAAACLRHLAGLGHGHAEHDHFQRTMVTRVPTPGVDSM